MPVRCLFAWPNGRISNSTATQMRPPLLVEGRPHCVRQSRLPAHCRRLQVRLAATSSWHPRRRAHVVTHCLLHKPSQTCPRESAGMATLTADSPRSSDLVNCTRDILFLHFEASASLKRVRSYQRHSWWQATFVDVHLNWFSFQPVHCLAPMSARWANFLHQESCPRVVFKEMIP